MIKKTLSLILAITLAIGLLAGCTEKEVAKLPTDEEVVLNVAGGWDDCRAIDVVAAQFNELYPNCKIVYEYLQDYRASLEKRLDGEDKIDIFFTSSIQSDNPLSAYALDLNSAEGIDLSQTFDGLRDNFIFREEGAESPRLLSIPVGAEMRGLYINKTLLSSLGLEVPRDRDSLLAACQVLVDNGYIPFHGNPGDFAQTLIYPWMCNIIANAENGQELWTAVDERTADFRDVFSEPCQFLYGLVENDFYDYKRAQTELGLFTENAGEDYARYFFNIEEVDGKYVKKDDVGQVAFLPSPMSYGGLMQKTKDDYHSDIEFEFTVAPIGPDGGFAYMSCAHGIAINKNSDNLAWAQEFIDFLFRPAHNEAFAQAFDVIPNTKDAFAYISKMFDVEEDHISQLGQVTFSYDLYTAVKPGITSMSKGNNPKYMQDDGTGQLSLYPYDYYMDAIVKDIMEQ